MFLSRHGRKFCFNEGINVMTRVGEKTRRRNVVYRFRQGERTVDCTCAEFCRLTGFSPDHVDHLAKGRAGSIHGLWQVDGYFIDGNLVPVSFRGSPRPVFTFRKFGSGYTIRKTRADMVRLLKVHPTVVYRAIRRKQSSIGDWALVW